eukprot:gene6024-11395_t
MVNVGKNAHSDFGGKNGHLFQQRCGREPIIDISDENISFKCFGFGARGENYYDVSLDLFGKIDLEKSTHNVTDRCMTFSLAKVGKDSWPRLLKNQQKPEWLKVDFDKMVVDDSETEEVDPKLKNITFENRMKSDIERAEEEISVFLKIAYLAIYNSGQGIAFWVIVGKLLHSLYAQGHAGFYSAYDNVSDLFLTCQLCACLEILNPMFRIVNTGVVAPLIQVGGRNFILFVLILPNKELHTSGIVYVLFMAWAAIEMVRYPFYVTSLFRKNFRFLTWLRYSLWVVLYPLGLTCEGLIVYRSIPYAEETRRISLDLPNQLNFSFKFSYFLRCYMFLLVFVLPEALRYNLGNISDH